MAAAVMLFAGGGTGGHLFPGVAVADALRRRLPQARILFLTTSRPLDTQVLGQAGYDRVVQPVQPFSQHPWRWWSFWRRWQRSVRQASRLIQDHRAAAVLGLGGYAAGPAVCAADRAGCATALLNPDLIPGRANRYLTRRADAVFCQWDESRSYFPVSAGCVTTGCPIRAEFSRATRAAGVRRFDLDPARRTILVTGASQGAANVNEAFMAALPSVPTLADQWQILHLTGSTKLAEVRSAYEKLDCRMPKRLVGFTAHMADAMAAADLVVSRAGASTLAELTAVGRAAVLLPYPYHPDQHQRRNAEVVAGVGAARMVTDTTDSRTTAQHLAVVLNELLAEPGLLEGMAAAARRLGRPDAAAEVADRLARLAGLC